LRPGSRNGQRQAERILEQQRKDRNNCKLGPESNHVGDIENGNLSEAITVDFGDRPSEDHSIDAPRIEKLQAVESDERST